ncbi:MAG: hypothetical protein WC588_02830 [Candidatus Micrarchaeia archaeon]
MASGRRKKIQKNDPRDCGFGVPGGSNFICTNPGKCGNQKGMINGKFCGRQGMLGNIGCGMGQDTPAGVGGKTKKEH